MAPRSFTESILIIVSVMTACGSNEYGDRDRKIDIGSIWINYDFLQLKKNSWDFHTTLVGARIHETGSRDPGTVTLKLRGAWNHF